MIPERRIAEHLGETFAHPELAQGLAHVEHRLRRRRRLRRGGAASIVVLAAGVGLVLAWPPAPRDIEPLTLASGAPLAFVEGRSVALSDGSSVALADGSDVSVLGVRADAVVFEVRHGSVRFDVRPGGARRWSVEAGPLRVDVVGTAFTVSREGAWASVAVHRGVVEIATANETRRLYAGERFEAGAPVALAADDPRAARSIDTPPSTAASEDPRHEEAALAVRASRPRSPPEHDAVRPRPAREGPAPVADSRPLADLLAEADRARREGRVDDATAALWAIVAEHPGASEAATAAVTAGQLEQQRGRFDAAIAAYRRALTLRPPPALAELCYEQLVQCHLARSDRAAAEATAAEHRDVYGDGTRTDAIEALLERR